MMKKKKNVKKNATLVCCLHMMHLTGHIRAEVNAGVRLGVKQLTAEFELKVCL